MIITLNTVNDLRTYYPLIEPPPTPPDPPTRNPMNGDIVYVKYHTVPYDGGGGFFHFIQEQTYPDNNGTIIKNNSLSPLVPGRWTRKFDGYIDIRFFGCIGAGDHPTDGDKIQAAIDFAAHNVNEWAFKKGSTVYLPCGKYLVNNTLVLKPGVSIIGDSMTSTIIRAGYTTRNDGWLLTMAAGRIEGCNIANITFDGMIPVGDPGVTVDQTKGCIYFEALDGIPPDPSDGGLWNCTFKNIRIRSFNGGGIHLIGSGEGDYSRPNQLCVFENVYVSRQKDSQHSLLISGLHGQMSFINCGFSGITYGTAGNEKTTKGINISIVNAGVAVSLQPAVISFYNCTSESSEYGFYIRGSENISIDTCWFETLDMAITATVSDEGAICKSINVLNSRFANAAGFGSMNIINRHTDYPGRCITSVGAEMNICNNYVLVSSLNPSGDNPPFGKLFVMSFATGTGFPSGASGVRTFGNSFQDNRLGYSNGIAQPITVVTDTLYPTSPIATKCINIKDNRLVFVAGSAGLPATYPIIQRIDSSAMAGETICIRADIGGIKFSNAKNIFLSGKTEITLAAGDIATFVKIDNATTKGGFSFYDTFQLTAMYKSTSDI